MDTLTKALIGERVKQALREANKEVVDLAKHLKLTKHSVYRWIRGEVEPHATTLEQIGDFTGKPLAYFLSPPGVTVRFKGNGRESKEAAAELVVTRAGSEVARIKLDTDTALELRVI